MDTQRMDDVLVHPEFHEVEAAENRRVLVLPAAGDTEIEPFCLISQFRQLVQIPLVAAKLVEAAQHRRRLRRTPGPAPPDPRRSEEHTSELQSLMRISYAVFCLKKKNTQNNYTKTKN